jgi:hypothetical protein
LKLSLLTVIVMRRLPFSNKIDAQVVEQVKRFRSNAPL